MAQYKELPNPPGQVAKGTAHQPSFLWYFSPSRQVVRHPRPLLMERAGFEYTYCWDHAPPGKDQGVYHESGINDVLNNFCGSDAPWEATDYERALKMSVYGAIFAKTGNPNLAESSLGMNLTKWPPTPLDQTLILHVDDGFGAIKLSSPEQVAAIVGCFSFRTSFEQMHSLA
ncbi:hypothetical protein BKA64DRAFT_644131 [Cadophora sp. MPI-SDFR-AT-0126]|nr:hypothetical protein BKA64DRAFT_644131 [Leotiomycetes sp. MPI-SDFR-AT-0126]